MGIKERNDELRKNAPFAKGRNKIVFTCGIQALRRDFVDILTKVVEYNDFNEDNDPHGEHDFGSFDQNGNKIFWKIDNYDGQEGIDLLLTIMLAEEY